MSNSTFAYHSPADLQREAFEHDFWASYDDHRERYAAEMADVEKMIAADLDEEDFLCAQQRGITVEAYRAQRAAAIAEVNARQAARDAEALAEDDCPF